MLHTSSRYNSFPSCLIHQGPVLDLLLWLPQRTEIKQAEEIFSLGFFTSGPKITAWPFSLPESCATKICFCFCFSFACFCLGPCFSGTVLRRERLFRP